MGVELLSVEYAQAGLGGWIERPRGRMVEPVWLGSPGLSYHGISTQPKHWRCAVATRLLVIRQGVGPHRLEECPGLPQLRARTSSRAWPGRLP